MKDMVNTFDTEHKKAAKGHGIGNTTVMNVHRRRLLNNITSVSAEEVFQASIQGILHYMR